MGWFHLFIAYSQFLAYLTSCNAWQAMEMDAYPTKGSKNTLITFGVPELFDSSRPFCRIGERLTTATRDHLRQGYEAIMSCRAPAQGSGFYIVEISRNGRDFITTGFVFQYVELIVQKISPNLVMRSGGTRVLVQGSGFFPDCDCRSSEEDSAYHVDTAFVSSAILRCEAWHLSDGSRKNHGSSVAVSASVFVRNRLSEIDVALMDEVTVSTTIDKHGSSSREIAIEGDGFLSSLRKIWCKLGNVDFLGRTVSSTRCHCILPHVQHGSRSLYVSMNQVDFTLVDEFNINYNPNHVSGTTTDTCTQLPGSGALAQAYTMSSMTKFEIGFAAVSFGLNTDLFGRRPCFDAQPFHRPSITLVHPPAAFEGDCAILHVAGKDFVVPGENALDCLFGNERHSAILISSSIILCEAASSEKLGVVEIDTIVASSHHSVKAQDSVTRFTYISSPKPSSFLPLTGPTRGGTVIHVHGSGFTITESMACKFGSLQGNQPFQIAVHGRGTPGVIDGFKFV